MCPSCGAEMRIIAFISDHHVVDAILRHLATAGAKSPRGPPSTAALSVVSSGQLEIPQQSRGISN